MKACVVCPGATFEVYTPIRSEIGLEVLVCASCGLIQTTRPQHAPKIAPKDTGAGSSGAFLSCDADYSPIRVGKNQMTSESIRLFRNEFESLLPNAHVIDAAAARGHFCEAAENQFGARRVTAVEPDRYMTESWPRLDRTELTDVDFRQFSAEEPADFIFACHTMEHYARPLEFLEGARTNLVPGGHLLVDVPNVATILQFPVVDEYFYDRHRLYFSANSLGAVLSQGGFEVVRLIETNSSIKALARRGTEPHWEAGSFLPTPQEAAWAADLITGYATAIMSNRRVLPQVVSLIRSGAARRRPLVVLGGGRILDALVRIGGLDPMEIDYLVDNFLRDATSEIYGHPLLALDDIPPTSNALVVGAVRTAGPEVEGLVGEWNPDARFMVFPKLLTDAHNGAAP